MQRLTILRFPPCYRPLIRASNTTKYHYPPSILPPPSTTPTNIRFLSQTPSLTYPRKDDQDKDSINREATEYSKSGTDDASALQEDTAFDPSVTEPGEQKDKVGSKTGASNNPLEVSPANPDVSQPRHPQEGGSENSSKSSGTTSGRERSSGGGSAKKGSKVT
ncbi:MAG: hypothetical protein Q9178_003162 [Gyalolechia marmorata]